MTLEEAAEAAPPQSDAQELEALYFLAQKRSLVLEEKHVSIRKEVAKLRDLLLEMRMDPFSLPLEKTSCQLREQDTGSPVPLEAEIVELQKERDLALKEMEKNTVFCNDYSSFMEQKTYTLVEKMYDYYIHLHEKIEEIVNARNKAVEELQFVLGIIAKMENSLDAFQNAHNQTVAEKEKLASSLTEVTLEKESVATELKKVTMELRDVTSVKENLAKELKEAVSDKERLSRELRRLASEKGSLEGDLNNVSSEKESLARNLKKLFSEKEIVEGELNNVKCEKEVLATNLKKLSLERESLVGDLEKVFSEKESLGRNLTRVASEKQVLGGDLQKAVLEKDNLDRERKSISLCKESLEEDLKITRAQKEALARQSKDFAMLKERELRDVTSQKEALAKEVRKIASEKEILAKQLKVISSEKENLVRELKETASEKGRLESDLRTISSENDILARKLKESTSENVNLKFESSFEADSDDCQPKGIYPRRDRGDATTKRHFNGEQEIPATVEKLSQKIFELTEMRKENQKHKPPEETTGLDQTLHTLLNKVRSQPCSKVDNSHHGTKKEEAENSATDALLRLQGKFSDLEDQLKRLKRFTVQGKGENPELLEADLARVCEEYKVLRSDLQQVHVEKENIASTIKALEMGVSTKRNILQMTEKHLQGALNMLEVITKKAKDLQHDHWKL